VGFQVIFGTFFMSILGIKRTRHPATEAIDAADMGEAVPGEPVTARKPAADAEATTAGTGAAGATAGADGAGTAGADSASAGNADGAGAAAKQPARRSS
jgi:hypothetical protein